MDVTTGQYVSIFIESDDPEKDAREMEEASTDIRTKAGRGGFTAIIPDVFARLENLRKTAEAISATIVSEGMGTPGRKQGESQ